MRDGSETSRKKTLSCQVSNRTKRVARPFLLGLSRTSTELFFKNTLSGRSTNAKPSSLPRRFSRRFFMGAVKPAVDEDAGRAFLAFLLVEFALVGVFFEFFLSSEEEKAIGSGLLLDKEKSTEVLSEGLVKVREATK